jgi:hypothetical protein
MKPASFGLLFLLSILFVVMVSLFDRYAETRFVSFFVDGIPTDTMAFG